MKLYADKLNAHLQQAKSSKKLATCYLLAGDEILLVEEAAQSIRAIAKANGVDEVERHSVLPGFSWNALLNQSANFSLFGGCKLIDVNLPSGKPGKEGGLIIKELIASLVSSNSGDCFILRTVKLDRGTARAAWVKAFEKHGVFVEFWPLTRAQWPRWVNQRLVGKGFKPSTDAVQLLVDRVEGNMLAAQQEIDKLHLLLGGGALDVNAVQRAVADSSHYDVFALGDAVLAGDPARALKIYDALVDEGVDATVILWAIVREWRILAQWIWRAAHGEPAAVIAKNLGVWRKRRAIYESAVGRLRDGDKIRSLLAEAQLADLTNKGFRAGDRVSFLRGLIVAMARGEQEASSGNTQAAYANLAA